MTFLARFRFVALLALAAVLAGCATGPKFAETSSSMPAVKAGDGRIFFYRSSSMMGAAIQPDVRLNGEVVGPSKPGGFF
jgi:starvation-inducible outer membrane lipoprotein